MTKKDTRTKITFFNLPGICLMVNLPESCMGKGLIQSP